MTKQEAVEKIEAVIEASLSHYSGFLQKVELSIAEVVSINILEECKI